MNTNMDIKTKIKLNKIFISATVLIILHTVGFFGLNSENATLFQKLTPVNLLVTLILLTWNQAQKNRAWYLFAIAIYIAGFLVEVLGVSTGVIFGEYNYGEALGPQWKGTPFLIGVNWLILVISTGAIAQYFFNSKIAKALIASTLMVLLDSFIEPLAGDLNFWYWPEETVPVQNYIAWWIIALAMHTVYQYLPVTRNNKIGFWVYGIFLVFFIALGTTLH